MANTPKLSPENQFPTPALDQTVQEIPKPDGSGSVSLLITMMASAADNILPWGINTGMRDKQLREFWPTETFLSGALANVSFRNAAADWEIRHSSAVVVDAITQMLRTAIAGDKIGWTDFVKKFSQDLYGQDNGAFIEIIRDPGMDATSKFKGPMAPVIGIASLDSGQWLR